MTGFRRIDQLIPVATFLLLCNSNGKAEESESSPLSIRSSQCTNVQLKAFDLNIDSDNNNGFGWLIR